MTDREAGARTYLKVPFAEKDEAKRAGARWDPEKRAWYVPADSDLQKVGKWSSGSAEPASARPVAEAVAERSGPPEVEEGEYVGQVIVEEPEVASAASRPAPGNLPAGPEASAEFTIPHDDQLVAIAERYKAEKLAQTRLLLEQSPIRAAAQRERIAEDMTVIEHVLSGYDRLPLRERGPQALTGRHLDHGYSEVHREPQCYLIPGKGGIPNFRQDVVILNLGSEVWRLRPYVPEMEGRSGFELAAAEKTGLGFRVSRDDGRNPVAWKAMSFQSREDVLTYIAQRIPDKILSLDPVSVAEGEPEADLGLAV